MVALIRPLRAVSFWVSNNLDLGAGTLGFGRASRSRSFPSSRALATMSHPSCSGDGWRSTCLKAGARSVPRSKADAPNLTAYPASPDLRTGSNRLSGSEYEQQLENSEPEIMLDPEPEVLLSSARGHAVWVWIGALPSATPLPGCASRGHESYRGEYLM